MEDASIELEGTLKYKVRATKKCHERERKKKDDDDDEHINYNIKIKDLDQIL